MLYDGLIVKPKGLKMNQNKFGILLIGWWLGIMTITAINYMVSDSKINQYNAAIKECEKSLPRDQKCVISAVVETKK